MAKTLPSKQVVYCWSSLPGREIQVLQKPAAGPAPVCKVDTTANWLVLGLSLAMAREQGSCSKAASTLLGQLGFGQLGLAGTDVLRRWVTEGQLVDS